MVGRTHGRRSLAAAMMFLAGCVGLGDSPPSNVATKRPRPRAAASPATPDLRIPADAVAQAEPDIPLVPVPPVPQTQPRQTPTAPPRSLTPPPMVPQTQPTNPPSGGRQPSERTQGADAPRSVQADGSQTTQPLTARQLLDRAAARCSHFDSYIVRLRRREFAKGKMGPLEIIEFSFRKNPFSVHFKWLGDTAKGREVVYVKDRFGNKIHTRVAAGDALLMPAGSRLSLSPDNPLVRSASRHPITDAGIDHCVQTMIAQLDAQERGDRRQGTTTLLPPQRRPEYPQPVETLERTIPPNMEPELPRGGRRYIYFDPKEQLPMLVLTYDDKGTEVEYYHYDRLITPAALDDDDFNPDKLWPQKNSPQNSPPKPRP